MSWEAAAIERCVAQVERGRGLFAPDAFPYVSRDGRYAAALVMVGDGDVPPWTAGFWVGELHLAHLVTGEAGYLEDAARRTALLGDRLERHGPRFDHDLGFQFLLSAVTRAELTGDERSRGLGLAAADRLAGRFNPAGGFIRAHGWEGSAGVHIAEPGENDGPPGRFITDTMMNLPLLAWAHSATGNERYLEVAAQHAETSRRLLVREDGWVHHAYDVDPATGEPLGPATIQGATETSPWSRAQAWALYGFALAAEHLGQAELLEVARRVAGNFLAGLDAEGLPPWDFSRPQGAATLPDSSAGAVAASGLLVLARSAGDSRYEDAARELLRVLESRCAVEPETGDGILTRACYHHPAGVGLQESAVWGDYFQLEALLRLRGMRVPYDLAASPSG